MSRALPGVLTVALCLTTGSLAAAAPPVLTVAEPELGTWIFEGIAIEPAELTVTAGDVLEFAWSAQPAPGGAAIDAYRYGWDLVDPDDPDDAGWTTGWSSSVLQATPRSFAQGLHALTVAVRDQAGEVTRGWLLLTVEGQVSARPLSLGAAKAIYRD